MNNFIRTPEERFANLPGYHFKSHYVKIQDDLRCHYLDEGSTDGPILLLLHGEPSWSYLYRKMVPPLAEANFRVIAPDLIGFGKSDKWTNPNDYSYESHINWMAKFLDQLKLDNIILFCQDWGGLIGLRLVAEMPERFTHIVASNTFLPTGQGKTPESFMKWREFSQNSSEFDIGKVIDMGTLSVLSPETIKAYNAPFPTEEYKAGARIFPTLVPIQEDEAEAINNKKAWAALAKWKKPFLTVFGDSDPIMKGCEKIFQKLVPGAKNQDHKLLHAGHFIQEDKGEELAQILINFYTETSNN